MLPTWRHESQASEARHARRAPAASRRMASELRDARLAAGVSQAAVARRAGISRSTLGRMERDALGDPTFTTVCRVARSLGSHHRFDSSPRASRFATRRSWRCSPGSPPSSVTALAQARGCRCHRGSRRACVGRDDHGGDVNRASSRRSRISATCRRSSAASPSSCATTPGRRVVLLVLTRSAHHRAVLAVHRESLRRMFPLDGRCRAARPARGARPCAEWHRRCV